MALDFSTGICDIGFMEDTRKKEKEERQLAIAVSTQQSQERGVHYEKQRLAHWECVQYMLASYILIQTSFPDHENRKYKDMCADLNLPTTKTNVGRSGRERLAALADVVSAPIEKPLQAGLHGVSKAFNAPIIEKAGTAVADGVHLATAAISLGSLVTPLSAPLSATSGTPAAIGGLLAQVFQLSTSVATLIPVLQVASPAATICGVWSDHKMIDALYKLKDLHRHDDATCETTEIIDIITKKRVGNVALNAGSMHMFVGAGVAGYKVVGKVGHKILKLMGAEPLRTKGLIAKILLDLARGKEKHTHENSRYTQPHPDGCPLAWMILATLFGHGNMAKGCDKTIEVVLSKDKKAIGAIESKLW